MRNLSLRGSWTVTANLNTPRYNGKVAALADGRVLIAGGYWSPNINPLHDAEIYDPANNTWTVTGSMIVGLPSLAMATLQDGTVLAVGGGYDDITSEVYVSVTGTWSQAATTSEMPEEKAIKLRESLFVQRRARFPYPGKSSTWQA